MDFTVGRTIFGNFSQLPAPSCALVGLTDYTPETSAIAQAANTVGLSLPAYKAPQSLTL